MNVSMQIHLMLSEQFPLLALTADLLALRPQIPPGGAKQPTVETVVSGQVYTGHAYLVSHSVRKV